MVNGTQILAAWQDCLTLRGTQELTGATRAMIVSVLQSHGIDYRRADKLAQPIRYRCPDCGQVRETPACPLCLEVITPAFCEPRQPEFRKALASRSEKRYLQVPTHWRDDD